MRNGNCGVLWGPLKKGSYRDLEWEFSTVRRAPYCGVHRMLEFAEAYLLYPTSGLFSDVAFPRPWLYNCYWLRGNYTQHPRRRPRPARSTSTTITARRPRHLRRTRARLEARPPSYITHPTVRAVQPAPPLRTVDFTVHAARCLLPAARRPLIPPSARRLHRASRAPLADPSRKAHCIAHDKRSLPAARCPLPLFAPVPATRPRAEEHPPPVTQAHARYPRAAHARNARHAYALRRALLTPAACRPSLVARRPWTSCTHHAACCSCPPHTSPRSLTGPARARAARRSPPPPLPVVCCSLLAANRSPPPPSFHSPAHFLHQLTLAAAATRRTRPPAAARARRAGPAGRCLSNADLQFAQDLRLQTAHLPLPCARCPPPLAAAAAASRFSPPATHASYPPSVHASRKSRRLPPVHATCKAHRSPSASRRPPPARFPLPSPSFPASPLHAATRAGAHRTHPRRATPAARAHCTLPFPFHGRRSLPAARVEAPVDP
ncbi:hypothetical protein GGX14DRAFT_672332 [Mycena pura]|uniref:Uncharacterized protein n=1 Tax=Mycena pura TaxID=153505 RepID=A0AAD6Y6M5_9AGAR|nr:hypothetical protein GGX14DRAFT_672332 [Mycena pura]